MIYIKNDKKEKKKKEKKINVYTFSSNTYLNNVLILF